MCAQFTLKPKIQDVASHLSAVLEREIQVAPELDLASESGQVFLPHETAPVLVKRDNGLLLTPMKFSLLPNWSKEPKVKFATHNARVTGDQPIFLKPTWRTPFAKNHCVVPISGFVEPIYTGKWAGQMVEFTKGEELLYAAGIWDHWVSKATGEVIESFAILTDEPMREVLAVGHDRSPVFLDLQNAQQWLTLNTSGEDMVEFLKKSKLDFHTHLRTFRVMKPGWEKRVPK